MRDTSIPVRASGAHDGAGHRLRNGPERRSLELPSDTDRSCGSTPRFGSRALVPEMPALEVGWPGVDMGRGWFPPDERTANGEAPAIREIPLSAAQRVIAGVIPAGSMTT